MTARPRACVTALVVAFLASACTSTPSAPPGASGTTGASAPPGTSVSSTPATSPTPATPSVFHVQARHDGSFLVRGRYPHVESRCVHFHQPVFEARYPGTVAVHRASDGSFSLLVTLPFEQYLQGIEEMPPSWPMAALEAQAIAARSYALASTGWSGTEGEKLKTPICSTTSCQVYGGMPIGAVGDRRRWYRAVRHTTGQVLVFDGRPADTVYFSTSNGHTYGNDQVFGSAPLPYLRPVVEHDDGASPVSHWSVSIRYHDLATFLSTGGEWPGGTPIRDVRLRGGNVVVAGSGASRTIDLSTFRDDVNTWASCLEPARYPPNGLPTTIPSSWLSMSATPHAVTVTGRGWGHGVGMVQWGAYGKARLGWSADRILAYYYGGLAPQTFPEPGLIHVEVASGLDSVKLIPSTAGSRIDGARVGRGPIVFGRGELLRSPSARSSSSSSSSSTPAASTSPSG